MYWFQSTIDSGTDQRKTKTKVIKTTIAKNCNVNINIIINNELQLLLMS